MECTCGSTSFRPASASLLAEKIGPVTFEYSLCASCGRRGSERILEKRSGRIVAHGHDAVMLFQQLDAGIDQCHGDSVDQADECLLPVDQQATANTSTDTYTHKYSKDDVSQKGPGSAAMITSQRAGNMEEGYSSEVEGSEDEYVPVKKSGDLDGAAASPVQIDLF
jgi:hypothetical protein